MRITILAALLAARAALAYPWDYCAQADYDTDGAVTVGDVIAVSQCIQRDPLPDEHCDTTGDAFANPWDILCPLDAIWPCAGIAFPESASGLAAVYLPPYTPETHPFWPVGAGWYMNLSRGFVYEDGSQASPDCVDGVCSVEVSAHWSCGGPWPALRLSAGQSLVVDPAGYAPGYLPDGVPLLVVTVDSVSEFGEGVYSVLEVEWHAIAIPVQ